MTQHIHKLPWTCRLFGHRMHNTRSRNVMLAEDACKRAHCPGPGHLWGGWLADPNGGPDDYRRRCQLHHCDATQRFTVPDMSLSELRSTRVDG